MESAVETWNAVNYLVQLHFNPAFLLQRQPHSLVSTATAAANAAATAAATAAAGCSTAAPLKFVKN
jgi:hypothetical protein